MSMRSGAVLATTVLALGGSLASSPVADAAASPPAQHHSAHGTASVTRVLTLPTAAGKPIAATVETGPDRLGPARPRTVSPQPLRPASGTTGASAPPCAC